MPCAEQRRRCSYRSVERILCVMDRSLGSRVVWAIELVEQLALRPSCKKIEASPPGCSVLWFLGVGAAGAQVSARRGSRRIASFSRQQNPNSQRTASGTLTQCEHAMSSWIDSSLSTRFDRFDPK